MKSGTHAFVEAFSCVNKRYLLQLRMRVESWTNLVVDRVFLRSLLPTRRITQRGQTRTENLSGLVD